MTQRQADLRKKQGQLLELKVGQNTIAKKKTKTHKT